MFILLFRCFIWPLLLIVRYTFVISILGETYCCFLFSVKFLVLRYRRFCVSVNNYFPEKVYYYCLNTYLLKLVLRFLTHAPLPIQNIGTADTTLPSVNSRFSLPLPLLNRAI